ncbi:alpha/beta hydrolase [Isoptericola sp. NEAU-Y5]|uniref:Alpha/beta hydrolase n=1 Tax=Isoptericola luteus TaxID=2879484 RepID=A0ABS7ZEZ2_9MICO|nr:alpha/beta hydrolase [Isoptericola sp. NEAU-Y5]MCA5893611.1 alpha/beta hydrolase [Isoptericola sp. NEAU-Y5]
MSTTPTAVLVHGAFADSSSWHGVVERLHRDGIPVVSNAVPLRSLAGDAAYLRDVIAGTEGPVLVVAHSYGGMVATEAASQAPNVVGLVYVGAFAPETGESAFDLAGRFPGSTLGETLASTPLSDGGTDLTIRPERFHEQFVADVAPGHAACMSASQRPVTQEALTEPLATTEPAWRHLPSWFVHGGEDRNIPPAALRFMAERAGSRGTTEVEGASHAVAVSRPDAVAQIVTAAALELELGDAAIAR